MISTNKQFVWKCFTRGAHPIVMDWWNGDQWRPIRQAMGQTRTFANRMNLAAMKPCGELASTTYCLSNPGREYLVYLPDRGTVTVDLSTAKGSLAVEWFNPRTGNSQALDKIAGGMTHTLQTPFVGDAVLYVRSEEL